MSLALSTISSNSTLRTRKDGKIIGQRMAFDGTLSASDLRKDLKAAGVTGRDLTKAVNAALTGTADVRWMKHDALTSAARSNGFIPDYADASANGKSMSVRYVAPASKGVDATAAALKAKEMENASMKAELEALKAQFAAVVEQAASAGK